jgi:putative ABC transport system permease protein
MSFGDLFAVAVGALRRHKLRSFLTLLGVIIGVMTVVSVVSIISGLNANVRDKVLNLNPDVIVFTKYGIIRSRSEFLIARKRKAITMRDAQVIEAECKTCGAVGTAVTHVDTVHAGTKKLSDVPITGYTANMVSMLKLELEGGRFFSQIEEEHAAAVAIIGADVREQVFPGVDPIGRMIFVRGYPLRVIGLQSKLGSFLGQNKDKVIFVPVTFVQKVLTSTSDVDVYIRPRLGMAGVDAAQDEVRTILRSIRKTSFRGDDPFAIVGSQAVQALWNSLTGGAFALMLLISGISLVVGAIVIANIMFVSVVERTKEIGVRRAMGARRRDIQRQFLLESALLSTGGGVVGVLLGAVVALIIDHFYTAEVKPLFAVLGVLVATVTGVLAGLAPSSSAARLPPVEALRYE